MPDGWTFADVTCRHAFHKGCLDEWLQKGKNNCPVCRSRVGFPFDPPRSLLISLFREFQSTHNPFQLPNLKLIHLLKGILELLSKLFTSESFPFYHVLFKRSSCCDLLPTEDDEVIVSRILEVASRTCWGHHQHRLLCSIRCKNSSSICCPSKFTMQYSY